MLLVFSKYCQKGADDFNMREKSNKRVWPGENGMGFKARWSLARILVLPPSGYSMLEHSQNFSLLLFPCW